MRQAATDFYFNSWRLAPANLVWAVVMIAGVVGAATWPPAALLLGLVGLPLAGLYRMAALVTRGESVAFSDFVRGARLFALPAVAATLAAIGVGIVLATNVALGLSLDNPFGWFLAASAVYAAIAGAMYLVAMWPLLVDPARGAEPIRARLALAGLVLLARPGRLLLLTFVLLGVLAASTVVLAGIALVAVAYVALVATRYVIPIADGIELARGVDRAKVVT